MATTAFALAGLGGFNAHGAGFLTAATACDVVPDLVTATSGQIVVLADWLTGADLEKQLVIPELEHNFMAQMAIAFSGDPGVFRPAYAEAIRRWFKPPTLWDNPLETALNRLLPAQVYVPTRRPKDFEDMAGALNQAEIGDKAIGVVFNAYDIDAGTAVLFGNDAAREKWWPRTKKLAEVLGGESSEPHRGCQRGLGRARASFGADHGQSRRIGALAVTVWLRPSA